MRSAKTEMDMVLELFWGGWSIRSCGNSPLQIIMAGIHGPRKVPSSEYQKSWHLVIAEKICILKEDELVKF